MNKISLMNINNRKELAKHQAYRDTKTYWDESKISTHDNRGNLQYLFTEAHNQKFGQEIGQLITREEWGKFYQDSGNTRKEKMKFSNATQNLNHFFGRTFQDIVDLAVMFQIYLRDNQFPHEIPLNILVNMTYFRIVDVAYILYVRQIGAIKNLIAFNRNPDLVFKMPTQDMTTVISAGVVVHDVVSGQIVSAAKFYRYDIAFVKDAEDELEERKAVTVYNLDLKYIGVDIYGGIHGNVPSFDEALQKVR